MAPLQIARGIACFCPASAEEKRRPRRIQQALGPVEVEHGVSPPVVFSPAPARTGADDGARPDRCAGHGREEARGRVHMGRFVDSGSGRRRQDRRLRAHGHGLRPSLGDAPAPPSAPPPTPRPGEPAVPSPNGGRDSLRLSLAFASDGLAAPRYGAERRGNMTSGKWAVAIAASAVCAAMLAPGGFASNAYGPKVDDRVATAVDNSANKNGALNLLVTGGDPLRAVLAVRGTDVIELGGTAVSAQIQVQLLKTLAADSRV